MWMTCVGSQLMLRMINTDLERKGNDANQCRKIQRDVFPHHFEFFGTTRPVMQGNDHEKSRASNCGQHDFTSSPCSKTIPQDHSKPSERPHQYPGFVSTLLQEVKQFDYLGAQTRPHDEYESCCGIHLGKGQQRPFSSPPCLLFPPLRQAPLQPFLLQFAC